MKFALIPVVAVAALVSGAAHAGTLPPLPSTFDASTGYVTMTASDGATVGGQSFAAALHWSDGAAPHSGTNYYVSGSSQLWTPHPTDLPKTDDVARKTFQGDSLVLAGCFWSFNDKNEITIPTLHAVGGGYFNYSGEKPQLHGTCYVHSRSSSPAYLMFAMNSSAIIQKFGMDLVGDEDSWFECRYNNSNNWALRLTGDLSQYSGTLRVKRHSGTATGVVHDGLYIDSPVLDGRLTCDQDTLLVLSSVSGFQCRSLTLGANMNVELTQGATVTVGDLTFGDGVSMDFKFDAQTGAAAKIVVTNALTVSGTVHLSLTNLVLASTAHEVELLQVPAGVALSAASFVPELSDELGYLARFLTLTVRDDGADGKTLVLNQPRMVTRIGPNSTGQTDSDYTNPTNAAGKYYWSDHLQPVPSNTLSDVTIYYNAAADSQTPNIGAKYLEIPALAYVLKGRTHNAFSTSAGIITDRFICDGAFFQLCTGSTSTTPQFKDLDGVAHSVYRIKGGVVEVQGSAATTFLIYEKSRLCRIESELVGGGPITLTSLNYAGNILDNRAHHEFAAFNTNFTGRIALTQTYNKRTDGKWPEGAYVPNMDQCVSLYVRDSRNLGGACESYTYNALELEQYSRLLPVDGDITLPSGLNRGLAIGNIGRIVVTNGLTCTVNWPITLKGKLLKEGAGTLVLGGSAMKFDGSAQSDTPTAGSNLVQVAAGWLKVTNADVLDGAALSFGSGAGLRFDVNPADADLATYGLCDVKTGGAISGDAVSVAFDGVTGPISHGTKLGLFTLATEEAATALKAKLSFGKLSHNTVSTVVEQTALGYTVSAVFALKPGMMLMFR